MEKYRENLVEKACEQDEEALEQYLETGEAPDVATLKKCIRKGTLSFSYLEGLGWVGWVVDYIVGNFKIL